MDVTIERGVPVPMRDGAVLSADVFRPAGGRHPVLVQRTPYGKELIGRSTPVVDPIRAAEAGYVVVVQDVRGRGRSDGDQFVPYRGEGDDCEDTIAWAAHHPAGDGSVGAFGVSYMGTMAWEAATRGPDGLRAVAASQAPLCLDGARSNGGRLALSRLAQWSLGVLGLGALLRTAGSAPDVLDRVDALIHDMDHLADQLLAGEPVLDRYIDVMPWLPSMADLDDAEVGSWLDLRGRHQYAKVPALVVAGWHDPFLDADLAQFDAMRGHAATEEARTGSRLVIGPWSHGQFGHVVGDIDFGLRADGLALDLRGDLHDLHIRWFDRWCRGVHNGIDEEAPVRVFVQGRNRWQDEVEWPPRDTTPTLLFLRSDGELSAERPSPDDLPTTYRFDPADLCPTRGGQLMGPSSLPCGPVDQAPLLDRADVAVFTTAPMPVDLELAGSVQAWLYGATDAPSTDWVVKLCVVGHDGVTRNLCDGGVRTHHRRADAVDQVVIPMSSTAAVISAGARLRVIITSSDFPRYDRGPTVHAAMARVFHDSSRASHLVLPVRSQRGV